MSFSTINFQIGKLGLTPGVLNSLTLAFKNHKQVRVSMLKSSGRDRESIKKKANELTQALSTNSDYQYSSTVIGFTIILNRLKK